MPFFVRKERCKYCAGELKDDKCTNPKCIGYVNTIKKEDMRSTVNIKKGE